jgi:hypothetical protein
MNKSLDTKHDKVTLVVVVTILVILFVFFAIMLPVIVQGDREYYNKTIVVSEINYVDPIDPISVVNIGIIDTDGEGYIITKKFDVTMKVGEMYDIQYYVRDNQGPRIISKIKPDLYIVTYNCDNVGDVCK